MKNIPLALKVILGVAVVAVLVVLFAQHRASSQAAGWEALGTAERAGNTLEALETASQAARGTAAEAWVDFLLARRLYDEGGAAKLERARQIAQQALDRHPDEAVAAYLSRLIAATESLSKLTTG